MEEQKYFGDQNEAYEEKKTEYLFEDLKTLKTNEQDKFKKVHDRSSI